jgi:hypothetical protein
VRTVIIRAIVCLALPFAVIRTVGARLWIENKYTLGRLVGDIGEDLQTFRNFWREA